MCDTVDRQAGDDIEVTVPSGERFYSVEKLEFI
jgi:hypothetical protein